ncbi:MAG: LytTR family transcriptional regulator [Bryobacterales bacterium]|nr:LytTR family transcriptional regulator [Bryobacterales bacterium]
MKTVRDGERCWFVRLTDLARFESHGNDTRLYFSGQRPLILRSLAYLEARLDPQLFFRASRRHIVNLSAGAHMEPAVDGGYELTLTSGPAVSMARHRAQEFRDRMLI